MISSQFYHRYIRLLQLQVLVYCNWTTQIVTTVSGIQSIGIPDSKVHGANMGPIWGRQDPGGPHVGPRIFAIWGNMTGIFNCAFCPSHESNNKALYKDDGSPGGFHDSGGKP